MFRLLIERQRRIMAKNEELVFGIHAVNALIDVAPERFIEIWLLKGREDDRIMPIINLSRKYGIGSQLVSRKVLDEKSEGEQHQGVIARVKPGKCYTENDLDDIILAAEKKSIPVILSTKLTGTINSSNWPSIFLFGIRYAIISGIPSSK